jgi:DNA-binding transcriptional LysR family regulator
MDRLDAMKVFVAALDEGSLAGAGRRLGRSPAAVSRAIAFLEQHVGAELLHRTTRSIKLSEAGERYAAACRRVLVDLDEADRCAAGERAGRNRKLGLGWLARARISPATRRRRRLDGMEAARGGRRDVRAVVPRT